jgi:hypothetical protein
MTGSDEPQPKRARHVWTLGDKLWLLDYADNNPKVSNADLAKALARHLNEGRPCDCVAVEPPSKQRVSEWKKNAADIRQQNVDSVASSQKRARTPKHHMLEEALALWFPQQEARSLIVPNDILRAQAKRFAPQSMSPTLLLFLIVG